MVALVVVGLCAWFVNSQQAGLAVHFLDVGQGDAILIQTPGHNNILIDGGPDDTVLEQLPKYLSWFDRKIDLVILTHPHSDHLFGLNQVLQHYTVGQVVMTDAVHNTPVYTEWLRLIQAQQLPVLIINHPQTITVDDLKLQILYPDQSFANQAVVDLNDTSIVLQLIYGQTNMLFMGDAGVTVEEKLLAGNIDLSAAVLKVGHHGSDSASSSDFLQAVHPNLAIISNGLDNQFGHPSQRTLYHLQQLGISILRTDQHGNITVDSDGQTLTWL